MYAASSLLERKRRTRNSADTVQKGTYAWGKTWQQLMEPVVTMSNDGRRSWLLFVGGAAIFDNIGISFSFFRQNGTCHTYTSFNPNLPAYQLFFLITAQSVRLDCEQCWFCLISYTKCQFPEKQNRRSGCRLREASDWGSVKNLRAALIVYKSTTWT